MRGKLNELDRIIRILLGAVLTAVGLTYQAWLVPMGIMMILTGMIGWCPLYFITGITTAGEEEVSQS